MTASRAMRRRRPERLQHAIAKAATLFCFVACVLAALALFSALHPLDAAGTAEKSARALTRRNADTDVPEDLECRLVHHAADKCAFIRANCPDEEAGLFSYLELYYCRLPHAKPLGFSIIALWLCLLFSTIGIAASDFFCINLSTIAQLLGLSESFAGVTFLAFGNGSPDVFSTFAAMNTNSGSLAVGELIGAASFITAVVAGAMAFVRPFKVARKSFVRDVSFFIIAASFSMAILYDGKLNLWEAISMVSLYIFYVIFVVIWHWYFNRRKRRKQAEAAARGHFVAVGSEIAEFPEYHDYDEPEQDDLNGRQTPRRGMSTEDISLLERGRGFHDDEEEEAREDERKRELGELNSEMRLSRLGRVAGLRPRVRERRVTQVPVRPSLIGALEFRSVLAGLKTSGNIQSYPLNRSYHGQIRRHSDDILGHIAPDARSMNSEPPSRRVYSAVTEATNPWNADQDHSEAVKNLRGRAISAPDPSVIRSAAQTVPRVDLLGPLNERDSESPSSSSTPQRTDLLNIPTSPTMSLSPSSSRQSSRSNSLVEPHTVSNASLLAPPDLLGITTLTKATCTSPPVETDHLNVTPDISSPKPVRPSLLIPSDALHFPPYRDTLTANTLTPSIRLPSPDARMESAFNPIEEAFRVASPKPPRWWPSYVLPTPFELWATLFPTLCGWSEKSWWERFLGVIAMPSVFALTITLPVVESDSVDNESVDDDIPDMTLPSTYQHSPIIHSRMQSHTNNIPILVETSPPHDDNEEPVNIATPLAQGLSGHGTSAVVAPSEENLARHHRYNSFPPPHPHTVNMITPTIISPGEGRQILGSPEQLPATVKLPSSRDWNRWLVILQAFSAPFFVSLILWAKLHISEPAYLLRYSLVGLAISLICLVMILLTTSPTHAPPWRSALCFAGFLVSITWISSIADEVVGALKSIGVILNISDAILGLTIFAVGNSLGDLVADYTVAKLGYPVMALSACFGGPMLNILLGIGLSGCYLTIKHARQKQERHPGDSLKLNPYKVEVSQTLMISCVTLLLTLVGLLVVVPLRRWKMDRFVACCLVGLWTVSTVGNVAVEIAGVGKKA